jgi:Tol biopolymer transport system component
VRLPSAARCLLTALVCAWGTAAAAASFPPHLRFRSIATERVTIHYHQGLEALARDAAALATEILERHEARYRTRVGRLQLVLADVEDDPNGFATPLPYPLVNVRAIAPRGADDFGNYDDWLRLVLTHELAHVVHLDQAHGLVRFGRKVLGRAPYLFPNVTTPGWMIEGLATYEETEGTAFGRGRNPDVRMIRRMAALEDDFLHEDEAVLGLDRWPSGNGLYLFGEGFLRDLSERHGPETLPSLARVHAGRVIPYLDELTSKKVTGASFHAQWKRWEAASQASFEQEADAIASRGLSASDALTRRGVRQSGARFSPDGEWIAYTSGTLTRFRALHVMRKDGTDDRRVALRNGGRAVAWTPDGRSLVFDEPEVHRTFSVRSDLRVVDVARGGKRALTKGARAKDPDVSPDGALVVFVRQDSDRSELATVPLAGGAPRDLTRSEPGVQWNSPRFSPDGTLVAASRFAPGGWLDLVIVDAETGEIVERLTEDRAKDVEPAWTPDSSALVFRSDRDGVSNLYALRLEDRALLRVTRVLGGAFAPDVDPGGGAVAFAGYSARGYDLHVTGLDADLLEPAEPFHDPYPAAPSRPAPAAGADRPYRPFPTALPRFWSPYPAYVDDEWRVGVVTGGADPLLRHVYAVDAHWGFETERPSGQVFYQYDRFRPTLQVGAQIQQEPQDDGSRLRNQELTVRASVPVVRRLRWSQAVSLAWRRSREQLFGSRPARLDLGGLEAAWAIANVKRYPLSISPVDGQRLRVAFVKESPSFGSDVALGKLLADGRAYLRALGENHVLALMAAGGTTFGRPSFEQSFEVGGFPDGSLLDVVRTNNAVLRGYRDGAFSGRRFVSGSVEYRIPLWHPQRGVISLPFFVRSFHAAVFADAGHAWSGTFRWDDLKTSAGGALGADLVIGQALPVTVTAGVARGLTRSSDPRTDGDTRFYFRTGLAF